MGGSFSYKVCEYADAARGGQGKKVTTAPLVANPGENGSIVQKTFANTADTYKYVAKDFSLLYYEMALRAIEVVYVNGDVAAALKELTWLGNLLFDYEVISSNREGVEDYGETTEIVNQQEIGSLRSRVFMLIRRISLNLDFFGNSPSYVPLVAYRFYASVIDEFLEHAQKIESAYIRYRDASGNLSVQLSAARENIDSQLDFITSLERGFERINESEEQLVADLEFLTNQYENKWYAVQQAGEDFKRAVEREANNCSFQDVIKTVATIAVGIKTMGAGWALAAEAYATYDSFDAKKDANDKLGDLAEPVYKVKKIVKVGEGVSNMAKGLNQIVDLLGNNDTSVELPADEGKLLATREELNRTIDPFRHLPEAQEYLAAVDEFIELVTTRNNKILEYNELNNLRSDISFEIEKQESEIGRLRGLLNNPNASSLPEFANFMGRANLSNKKSIIQLLYSEHKSMEYVIARKVAFTINRDSVAHLAQVHMNIKRIIVEEMENRGRNAQPIKFNDNLAKFSIKEVLGEDKIQTFKEEGEIFFFLPELRYENIALVKFKRVVISIPGLRLSNRRRGEDYVGMTLSHLGAARIRTLDRGLIEFNHDTRTTFVMMDPSTDTTIRPFSLGGDGDNFIQLTPSGPWSLSIVAEDMDRVDLRAISDIQLNFEGEYYSLP
jgi:hypothetical protein